MVPRQRQAPASSRPSESPPEGRPLNSSSVVGAWVGARPRFTTWTETLFALSSRRRSKSATSGWPSGSRSANVFNPEGVVAEPALGRVCRNAAVVVDVVDAVGVLVPDRAGRRPRHSGGHQPPARHGLPAVHPAPISGGVHSTPPRSPCPSPSTSAAIGYSNAVPLVERTSYRTAPVSPLRTRK